jgi:O-succinylbenzoate synthase
MKVFSSRYEHGAVLRVVFDVGYEGYADLRPWPEYGEPPLESQLKNWLQGNWSTGLQKTFWFAAVDAKARRQNRNLLAGLDLPRTHAFEELAPGFEAVKIKMRPEKTRLPSNGRLRLDFNGSLTRVQFEEWWKRLSADEKSRIDWIEDPYSTSEPCEVPSRLLFSDWVRNPHWLGRIAKPSREFVMPTGRPIAFTHSLNHPIGQAAAIWEAARFYKRYPQLKQTCGFPLVEAKAFQKCNLLWNRTGAILKPAPGLGFGFDAVLRELEWERLL